MRKVLVIVPFPLDEQGLAKRRAQVREDVIAPDMRFTFTPTKVSPAIFDSWHDKAIAMLAIFEAGMHAEDEGYDAVCIDSFGDSGMEPLRSVLSIPVIGGGIASYAVATMLGEKFSIITLWDGWIESYTRSVASYKVADRLASIRAIDSFPDVENLLSGKEEEIFPKLREIAMECVEKDGADVLLLGSTTMHQAADYLNENVPVPVINPGLLTYKMVDLLTSLNLSHSRSAYPSPMYPKRELIAAMVEAGAGFEARRGEHA